MEYFYGRKPQTFFPFSYDVPFSEVKIYKIGGEFTAGIPYNRSSMRVYCVCSSASACLCSSYWDGEGRW